jgi:hypothetical protein
MNIPPDEAMTKDYWNNAGLVEVLGLTPVAIGGGKLARACRLDQQSGKLESWSDVDDAVVAMAIAIHVSAINDRCKENGGFLLRGKVLYLLDERLDSTYDL